MASESPRRSTLSPTWRPPKSPLPPHRLAKLANALGVSTPIPAGHPAPYARSHSDSAAANPSPVLDPRRSPTPSTAASALSFASFQPSTSKFLLHVVPPTHLPHDSDDDVPPSARRTPPPPNAAGYHTHFRRGTLVPVHPTLHAQLGAIAKEYALPSAAGLILYLVTQSPDIEPSDEPGPRLSEDIWKHLWTRVLRAEQRDDVMVLSPSLSPLTSRSATPATPMLQTPRTPFGLGMAARSTPFLPQENASNGPLRPLLSLSSSGPGSTSPGLTDIPPYSPQAAYASSSLSDIRSAHNKSAPPSSTSHSQSEADHPSPEPSTPDTSVVDDSAQHLPLPGLNSPSLIPILAKVEFDIDRRKAAWYEPWVRSRRANFAKRARVEEERGKVKAERKGSESGEAEEDDDKDEEEKEKSRGAPIELLMGKKDKRDPFGLASAPVTVPIEPEDEEEAVDTREKADDDENENEAGEANGYARLSDEESDDDDEYAEENTARVMHLPNGHAHAQDPLSDMFGSDADTWAEMHAESGAQRRSKHLSNPNILNLALTAQELEDDLHDEHEHNEHDYDENEDDDTKSTKEEDDVFEMLDMMGNPKLAMSLPSPEKSQSQSQAMGMSPRKIPPPLLLKAKDKSVVSALVSAAKEEEGGSAMGSPAAARLAYLGEGESPDRESQGLRGHQRQQQGQREEKERAMDEEEKYMTRVRSPTESLEKRAGAVFDDLDFDLGLDPTEDVCAFLFLLLCAAI